MDPLRAALRRNGQDPRLRRTKPGTKSARATNNVQTPTSNKDSGKDLSRIASPEKRRDDNDERESEVLLDQGVAAARISSCSFLDTA